MTTLLKRRRLIAVLAGSAVVVLAGCGRKGALKRPEEAKTKDQEKTKTE